MSCRQSSSATKHERIEALCNFACSRRRSSSQSSLSPRRSSQSSVQPLSASLNAAKTMGNSFFVELFGARETVFHDTPSLLLQNHEHIFHTKLNDKNKQQFNITILESWCYKIRCKLRIHQILHKHTREKQAIAYVYERKTG